MYRPDLLKPDGGSAYYELTGVSIPEGRERSGGYLVEYKWREFDILDGFDFDDTVNKLYDEVELIISENKWSNAKGVVFRFDITETGTTTFAELFIDLERKTYRQVLYNLKSRIYKEGSFTTTGSIIEPMLEWMPKEFKTYGQRDLVSVSSVTYKRLLE